MRWGRVGLWLVAGLVVAALLLTPLYLVLRASQTLEASLNVVLHWRMVRLAGNTLVLAAAVTVASIALAVPLAWLTTRTDLPLRRLWAVLTPLPLVVPSYVGAYLFVSALGPVGLVQQWLEPLGVARLPSVYGFFGAWVVLTVLSYPYVLLSARAALTRMDASVEEAARSLGLNGWQTFWRVTLPHLRPAIGAGGLLVALYVLRDFGTVAALRYDTFTRVLYVQYRSFNRETAAATALVLIVLTLVVVYFEMRSRGRARYVSAGVGASRPPTVVRLGAWRWPALLFVGGVVFVGLIAPAGLLGYWLVRGLAAGEVLTGLVDAAWHSVLGSTLAAGVSVVVALPLSVLLVRYHSRATRWLEQVTYSAFALPGIVVALALVFFGANYALWLYQTLALLVFAYLLLFLPQALGAVRASLLQVHPSMEESGRSLGKGALRVFGRVTLPLTWPGMMAGAGLVFLTVMKELPATLILAPYGFSTLATQVWGAMSEAYFAKAAAPALLLILLSSVPMAFFVLRKQD